MPNLVLYALIVLIWGSTWLMIKFQLGVVPPELSIAYRFTAASGLIFAWCAWKRIPLRFTLRQHGVLLLLGILLFGVNYLCHYHATRYITTGLVSVAASLNTMFNAVLVTLLLRKPMQPSVWLGGVMGISGVALLFLPELRQVELSHASILGIALAILGTLSASFGNILSYRSQQGGMKVLPSVAYGMAYGAALSYLASAMQGQALVFDASPRYLMSFAYLVVLGSVVAFLSYLTLIGRIGADRAGYVAVMFPLIALALSTVFENFHWTSEALTGCLLILLGNACVLGGKRLLKPGFALKPLR